MTRWEYKKCPVCEKAGRTVHEMDVNYNCHRCGHVEDFDADALHARIAELEKQLAIEHEKFLGARFEDCQMWHDGPEIPPYEWVIIEFTFPDDPEPSYDIGWSKDGRFFKGSQPTLTRWTRYPAALPLPQVKEEV